MDFSVLVLGSNAPRPHVVSIQGYPPNLSVLDFLELAEGFSTFLFIDSSSSHVFSFSRKNIWWYSIDERVSCLFCFCSFTFDRSGSLNWNMMVLRKWGEPLPLQMNEPLTIEKGGQIVLGAHRICIFAVKTPFLVPEPKDFSLLGIDLPNRKRPCNMPNLTKQWRVQELKLSLVLLHQLCDENEFKQQYAWQFFFCRPISERRCLDISLYRKSDQTFSDPIPNHLTLYQLDLNPDDRLVYNLKPLSFEPR